MTINEKVNETSEEEEIVLSCERTRRGRTVKKLKTNMCTVSLMPRAPGRDEVPQHPLDRLGLLREDYELRMGTFELWSNPSINTKDLCDNGFYYMGIGDKVQCAFCGGVLSGWSCGDNIHIKHATHYGHCIVVRMVKHNRYAVYNDRLSTYNNWPQSLKQDPVDLAAAGLFYKGEHDICVCYMCGGHITEWEDSDIPEIEHKQLFPRCPLSQRPESNVSFICQIGFERQN
ncbi:Hypothetical predicted protein [Mytilus galloprovincialis]|uniref:Uncharacterized protein n=1 Tax=Mytilus galloprovincialis TaxID=29158 RepID=A0A8B6HM09_MYTGA|nr:Hypothetical predicted protein [Mytilus galloprovincialis]